MWSAILLAFISCSHRSVPLFLRLYNPPEVNPKKHPTTPKFGRSVGDLYTTAHYRNLPHHSNNPAHKKNS